MPKIFISYRRKSWTFTDRLVDELAKRLDADIFIDRTSIDQDDFERSILNHLRGSQLVLLIVSEYTFQDRIHRDDDWVRLEIREALTRDIPLVMVRVDGLLPPSGLPDDIKDVARKQGIPFYAEFFTPAVDLLTDFIVRMGVAQRLAADAHAPAASDEKRISGRTTLDEALALLDSGDFNKAVFLLESLRESGYTSRYVDLEALLERAQVEAEKADQLQRAKTDYDEIAAMAARKFTEDQAQAAFWRWCMEYPLLIETLDTANLSGRFGEPAKILDRVKSRMDGQLVKAALRSRSALDSSADAVRAIIGDPFEWCEVPAGEFIYGDDDNQDAAPRQILTLPAFVVAKYPITYRQFQFFIDAKDGFRDVRWWEGLESRRSKPPDDQEFKFDDHPRENVSWYDSVAFCRWLSFKLGGVYDLDKVSEWVVRLPTEFEWEKAARGTDGRVYPYGDQFHAKKCNTQESNIGKTTPVTQYPQGVSPYGTSDMCGNVLEWCLSNYDNPAQDAASENMRSEIWWVVRGGSWQDDQDFARASCRGCFRPFFRSLHIGFRVCRSLDP